MNYIFYWKISEMAKLYQILVNLKFTPVLEWQQICNTINDLPKEHTTVIYVLILHHYFLESSTKLDQQSIVSSLELKLRSKSLPFNGKTFDNGKGAMYTVEKLPAPLRHIISAYVHLITNNG